MGGRGVEEEEEVGGAWVGRRECCGGVACAVLDQPNACGPACPKMACWCAANAAASRSRRWSGSWEREARCRGVTWTHSRPHSSTDMPPSSHKLECHLG